MRRVAIVGCRPPAGMASERDVDIFKSILRDVREFVRDLPYDAVVISGGADGVDTVAIAVATDQCHRWTEYLPDYKKHGSRAPLVRNQFIVNDCDELHAWPAPWSRGTWHTVRLAREAGKPVTVHEVRVP